jgi:hypothetical protein
MTLRVTIREVSADPRCWELLIDEQPADGSSGRVRLTVSDVTLEVMLGKEANAERVVTGTPTAQVRRFVHGGGSEEPLGEAEKGTG